ncbi:2Fe-2S iron-sulfur cluster-binding protein, partial [Pseudomonas sp. SIMBA_064]
MPTITFIQPDGSEQRIDAPVGLSVMQAAVNNQVPGILGDCGGSCSCATCHGYVDREWAQH